MSSDVILYCEHLKLALSSQDTKKASTYLDAIDHYFNDRISQNEIGNIEFAIFFLSLKNNHFDILRSIYAFQI